MTFSYNGAIPNPPNDPASDVSTMQTNAASIGSIISVDHVGFNTAGGGQHNQVTFNANNVPIPPVSPPILFTNTVQSLPQLFFYSGSAVRSSNQYYNSVATGNAVQGSALLLGGVIIKWGTYTIPGGNFALPITFNTAFPNSIFSVTVTCTAFGTNNDILCTAVSPATTGFSGQRIGSPGGGANYSFIAVGN